ncbi:probable E3 ubiquitin-protein ligase MARCHF10 isoform X2 [Acipenser ruthenus]|uniref:probable E3 ubiquitin-protein ligase MARCHF10 isoform X2 n=1 Tax=Acipenser ruthenus TaxID=7906 RepID=UPI0027415F1D|nr:probable E3 ubiquitin-protein ligase MARCHF10 isoform X2 [Acipenser ruthenus]
MFEARRRRGVITDAAFMSDVRRKMDIEYQLAASSGDPASASEGHSVNKGSVSHLPAIANKAEIKRQKLAGTSKKQERKNPSCHPTGKLSTENSAPQKRQGTVKKTHKFSYSYSETSHMLTQKSMPKFTDGASPGLRPGGRLKRKGHQDKQSVNVSSEHEAPARHLNRKSNNLQMLASSRSTEAGKLSSPKSHIPCPLNEHQPVEGPLRFRGEDFLRTLDSRVDEEQDSSDEDDRNDLLDESDDLHSSSQSSTAGLPQGSNGSLGRSTVVDSTSTGPQSNFEPVDTLSFDTENEDLAISHLSTRSNTSNTQDRSSDSEYCLITNSGNSNSSVAPRRASFFTTAVGNRVQDNEEFGSSIVNRALGNRLSNSAMRQCREIPSDNLSRMSNEDHQDFIPPIRQSGTIATSFTSNARPNADRNQRNSNLLSNSLEPSLQLPSLDPRFTSLTSLLSPMGMENSTYARWAESNESLAIISNPERVIRQPLNRSRLSRETVQANEGIETASEPSAPSLVAVNPVPVLPSFTAPSTLRDHLPLALLALSELRGQAGSMSQGSASQAGGDPSRPAADPEKLRKIKESLLEEDSDEDEGDLCRICQSGVGTLTNPLLEPCQCTGSIQYIHQDCLKQWVQAKIKAGAELSVVRTCELCKESLKLDLDGFNVEECYQKHREALNQEDLSHSGMYLVLLLHLYEQRFAELLRLSHSRYINYRLARPRPLQRSGESERTISDEDDHSSENQMQVLTHGNSSPRRDT